MKSREAGILNVLLVPVIVLCILAAGVTAFGAWSYTKYQDYKNNTDQKVAAAVTDAKQKQQTELAAQFAEQAKSPTRKFSGPEQLGTVGVTYPKTWSVYVGQDGSTDNQFEAYFNPDVVPPITDHKYTYALRITIQQRDYADFLKTFDSQIQKGLLKATPIKLQSGEGMRLDGTFVNKTEGAMVLFALRDKVVQVYTESKEFVPDFDKTILPTLTFIP
ncbi:MAG TPA: hypothetical protein VLF60_01520 [Candidatus Saccharimonadales bacterium]|nr:hypothetical protein [Candidatus Saccharimonadales bacterium]